MQLQELRDIPQDWFDEIKSKPDVELYEEVETEFYRSDCIGIMPNFDLTLYSCGDKYYMRHTSEWYISNDKFNKQILIENNLLPTTTNEA